MKIGYHFTFEDGTRKVFTVSMDAETLNVIPSDNQEKPEWAKLANYRCQDCQLEENGVRYCPIAVNISSVVDFFKAYTSHDKVEVLVVCFHLPFATVEETVFRSASTYLLGQYFLRKQGKQADLDLVELADLHNGIQMVNRGMWKRFLEVVGKDAVNNAVICLDMFAKELPYAIEDSLEELEELFRVYWQ